MNTNNQPEALPEGQQALTSQATPTGFEALAASLPRVPAPSADEVDRSLAAARASKRGTRAEIPDEPC